MISESRRARRTRFGQTLPPMKLVTPVGSNLGLGPRGPHRTQKMGPFRECVSKSLIFNWCDKGYFLSPRCEIYACDNQRQMLKVIQSHLILFKLNRYWIWIYVCGKSHAAQCILIALHTSGKRIGSFYGGFLMSPKATWFVGNPTLPPRHRQVVPFLFFSISLILFVISGRRQNSKVW